MDDFKLNDRVIVIGKNTKGKIAFIGGTHFAEGVMFGVVLDEPKGKYSGTVGDIRYFECPKNYATFVRACQLEKDTNCSLEDGTMPAYPNYLKDNSSKHVLKTQDVVSKSERSNQTTKIKPVDLPNFNITKSKLLQTERCPTEVPIVNEDINLKPNYLKGCRPISGPQELLSKSDTNLQSTEEMLLTMKNLSLAEQLPDGNNQKGDKTVRELGMKSVFSEQLHGHKIHSLNDALEELSVLKQQLSEQNKHMNAIHNHLRKLKIYLKWSKEIRKSNNIGDYRMENFFKLLVDSVLKKIEKIVSKGSNEMSLDCSKEETVSSEENNFLLLYIDILEKRNEVLAESLTHVRNILERAWNQSRSKNRCKCKEKLEAPDAQGQCRKCSSKLLSFTDVLEHETRLFLETNPVDYLEPIQFSKGLEVFKGSEKIKKYLESLIPHNEVLNQEKVEIQSIKNNGSFNFSIDPQKISAAETTEKPSLFQSFTEPDVSLKYKNCPRNKMHLKPNSRTRKHTTKRIKETSFKNIRDPTKELQEFITEIISRVFEINKAKEKCPTENPSNTMKLEKPVSEDELGISIPGESNTAPACQNPSKFVEEAKSPKSGSKNKSERTPKRPKGDVIGEMKLLCACFLLVAVSIDAVPLEGSISENVKNLDPSSTVTPSMRSSVFEQFRETLLKDHQFLQDTLRETLNDNFEMSDSPEENLDLMDEPVEEVDQSLENKEMDYPLGSLFEWLEEKAESIKESQLHRIWLNRKKRSSNGQDASNVEHRSDMNLWTGWSKSESELIASLFEEYINNGNHKHQSHLLDASDEYEVQEFSEDDLRDIEPVETHWDGEVVTPTDPLEESHKPKHQVTAKVSYPITELPFDHQEFSEPQEEHKYEPHEEHQFESHEQHPSESHEERPSESHDGHEFHLYEDHFEHDDEEEIPQIHYGEIHGIPGEQFPDYKDIPLSSFDCSNYEYVPGFYADMETGCQVFHVCYQKRKASFLCPVGTIFNQAVLSCDFWYKSNCSQTPQYYSSNPALGDSTDAKKVISASNTIVESIATEVAVPKDTVVPSSVPSHSLTNDTNQVADLHLNSRRKYPRLPPSEYLDLFLRFFPVKAKVTVFPVGGKTKVVAVASVGNIRRKTKNHNRGHGVRAEASVHLDRNGRPVAELNPNQEAHSYGDDVDEHREVKPFSEEDEVPDREAKPFSEEDVEPDWEAKPFQEEGNVGPSFEKPQPSRTDIDDDAHENIDEAFEIVRRVLEEIRRLFPRPEDYTYYPHRRPTRYPHRRPTRYPGRWSKKYPRRRTTYYPRRPTSYPSRRPTSYPSRKPTSYPSRRPTNYPSRRPTYYPSRKPTNYPSRRPTSYPSRKPTRPPTYPSRRPTYPSRRPTTYPSRKPCNYEPWSKKEKYPHRPGPTLVPINPRFVVKPATLKF